MWYLLLGFALGFVLGAAGVKLYLYDEWRRELREVLEKQAAWMERQNAYNQQIANTLTILTNTTMTIVTHLRKERMH